MQLEIQVFINFPLPSEDNLKFSLSPWRERVRVRGRKQVISNTNQLSNLLIENSNQY